MQYNYHIFSLGDQAIALEIAGAEIDFSVNKILIGMKAWLEDNSFDGLRDVVLGYRSIAIIFDFFQLSSEVTLASASSFMTKKLEDAYSFAITNLPESESRHIRIPVCYDHKYGFDLHHISQRNKISVEDIVRLHTACSYLVYLVGFLPGFPYLGFVDPRLEVPRHSTPRTNVPAGSIGIAGKQTGIYPFDSPGGWQIIGRTPVKLFDEMKFPPVIAEVGDTITFYSISEEEFTTIEGSSS